VGKLYVIQEITNSPLITSYCFYLWGFPSNVFLLTVAEVLVLWTGEYPVMHPGASYTWISSTHFSTTYGNMRGYFTMTNLLTGEYVCVCVAPRHILSM